MNTPHAASAHHRAVAASPTRTNRPASRQRIPLLTPIIGVGAVVLTVLCAAWSPAGPSPNQGATNAASDWSGSRPVPALVNTVAFSMPSAPAPTPEAASASTVAPGAKALECSGRSPGRGPGNIVDASGIQIDILLDQPAPRDRRDRDSSTRRGASTRRGPLVVGCGPDGQVVVLACAAPSRDTTGHSGDQRRESRQGDRRFQRGRFDLGDTDLGDTDLRDAGLGDVELGDVDVHDLVRLSDALGIGLDDLLDLTGLRVSGADGRLQWGRGATRPVNLWDLYTDTDTGYTDPDLDWPAGDGTRLAPLVRASLSHHLDRDLDRGLDQGFDRGFERGAGRGGDRSARLGVCQWLGH